MMRGVKAVIFDMDGVLIDSEPIHIRLERDLFVELGLEVSDEEHRGFLGLSSRDMFTRLARRHGLTTPIDAMVQDERRRYLAWLQDAPLPLVPGTDRLIRDLAAAGFVLAVASSAPREQIDLVLDRSGWSGHIAVRVSGDDVDRGKPHPEIFLEAAMLLDRSPAECTVLEDSANGVAAARAAGMRCIAFVNPNSGFQDLGAADHRVSAMDEARALLLHED